MQKKKIELPKEKLLEAVNKVLNDNKSHLTNKIEKIVKKSIKRSVKRACKPRHQDSANLKQKTFNRGELPSLTTHLQ